jgi:hypothetical protein
MLVVAGDVVLSQHLAGGSLLQIVSVLGGSLMTKASGLNGLSELVTDGIHLFGNELSSGEIIRFRLSDFSRVSAATMSCGGLAIDASNIYWTAARTIAPPCSDGMSGQIVRLIRTF